MANTRAPAAADGRPRLAARYAADVTNVWSVLTPLANKHNAVNLGQGFPNFPAPAYVKDAASAAVQVDELNQYAPAQGLPRLRNALAASYSPLFGRQIDPNTEILICQGATEGTVAAFQALLDPGDEAILLEPYYDMYPSSVTMAGGVPVYVPLRRRPRSEDGGKIGVDASDAWSLDLDELRAAITPRTKVLVLNTPQNPTGKVFTRNELVDIAAVVKEHDLLVISDEVYDRLIYEGSEHVRIATLPGMWDRTLTVGSAGKSFSVTGWKARLRHNEQTIGWVIGPRDLIGATLRAHSRIAFCVATPLQQAVAVGFEDEAKHNFFREQQLSLQHKRSIIVDALEELQVPHDRPQGAYFVLFDTSRIRLSAEELQAHHEPRDWSICRLMTASVGVAAIPPSAFYSDDHIPLAANVARFCFCKTEQTLTDAVERLRARLPAYLNPL